MARRSSTLGEVLALLFTPIAWLFRLFVGRKRADAGLVKWFYKTPAWKRLRYEHLAKQPACVLCGRSAHDGARMNVDHIKPLAYHWNLRLAPHNLQTLCANCNHGKGGESFRSSCEKGSIAANEGLIMADTRTPEQRRRIMQSVKTENTGPEWEIRRILHSNGFRYRLHPKKLPGRPDIVFPGKKKAIFVHGCFWHGHGCAKGHAPKSRLDYWAPKLKSNMERDAKKLGQLEELGWLVMTVWQCEIADRERLTEKLFGFLRTPNGEAEKEGSVG